MQEWLSRLTRDTPSFPPSISSLAVRNRSMRAHDNKKGNCILYHRAVEKMP